jgi:streptogramin lyase
VYNRPFSKLPTHLGRAIKEGIAMYSKIRRSLHFSPAKPIPMIILLFTLPAILLAQRWDKMAAFPVPTTYYDDTLTGVTSGPDGALWYTDSNRQVVGRMTTAGSITEYSVCCSPQPITSGPDGALWFGLSGAIGRITTDGIFTSTPLSSCCAQVAGITPGPDGALWFTENGCCGSGDRIGRITTGAVITEFPQIADSNPFSIVAGRDGALWFTEQSGNRIGRITTSGFIVELPVPSCCGPEYITVGQDGALWFTEPNANQIARINAQGVIAEYPLPNANSSPWGITGGPDGAIYGSPNRVGRG